MRRFLRFLLQADNGFFSAWDDFSESRRWVNANSFRWHCDSKAMVKRWDLISAEEDFFPGNGGR
jgi:hypothetical protein